MAPCEPRVMESWWAGKTRQIKGWCDAREGRGFGNYFQGPYTGPFNCSHCETSESWATSYPLCNATIHRVSEVSVLCRTHWCSLYTHADPLSSFPVLLMTVSYLSKTKNFSWGPSNTSFLPGSFTIVLLEGLPIPLETNGLSFFFDVSLEFYLINSGF